ncbi:MAG: ribosome maturation factor RimM [Aquabacterium sp.]|nr:ribosome maturation factor RimM [Aquabacterium sp.]
MTQAAPDDDLAPAFPDDAVEVGRVLGAWGIKGGIRVQPFSKSPDALFASRRWFIQPPEAPIAALGPKSAAVNYPPVLRITHSKAQGDAVVATAQELPDRNAAEAMKGARIFIARSSFPTAGDGEFYWIDLIGLAVVNRQGEPLGEVVGLIDTGAHSVLRIHRPDAPEGASPEASERLIPFVGAFIDDVNLAQRRITVDWGLDY